MRQIPGLLLLLLLSLAAGCGERRPSLTLAGGDAGGTLQNYAEGLARLLNQYLTDVTVTAQRSGGSVANLRRLEGGEVDLALVSAGDAYLGATAGGEEGIPTIRDSLAVVRLYGAVAQLIVRGSSPYQLVSDLGHTRIAVGSPGSGSALAARRFFSRTGLWGQIVPVYISSSDALAELSHGRIDAVWAMVGYPDPAIQEFSRDFPIRLLDLYDRALTSGFFQEYPFYNVNRLEAGSYQGQVLDVLTFQDGVLWLARPEVDADYLYRALLLLFSRAGQRQLATFSPVAQELDPDRGRMGIRLPLHPGAQRFWNEFEQRSGRAR